MSNQVAIVTTVRETGPILHSFLRYHLALGFVHIFVFFDDPSDRLLGECRRYEQVSAIPHDEGLRERWRRTDLYRRRRDLRRFLDREVMARQALNAAVAVSMAMERRIDWILHIDSDELFYSPGKTVAEHFRELGESGVERASYLNYEAVAESLEVDDFFREVTLFKRNPRVNPGVLEIHGLSPAAGFLFYSNGKSAARVCPGLLPDGVHGFQLPGKRTSGSSLAERLPRSGLGRFALRRSQSLQRWMLRRLPRHRQGSSVVLAEPAILHYACCGFRHFWNKYRTLGPFADKWFGTSGIASLIGDFHLRSRDVVTAGDREAAKAFYIQRAMLKDHGEIARLLRAGHLCRIEGPARLLAGAEWKP